MDDLGWGFFVEFGVYFQHIILTFVSSYRELKPQLVPQSAVCTSVQVVTTDVSLAGMRSKTQWNTLTNKIQGHNFTRSSVCTALLGAIAVQKGPHCPAVLGCQVEQWGSV